MAQVEENILLPVFVFTRVQVRSQSTAETLTITSVLRHSSSSFVSLAVTDTMDKYDIVCTVTGGGVTGQAGAIRHGLSRALLQASDEFRPLLKKEGFLTRDPRMKERKKYGLKAARRAPQFSKR